MAQVKNGDAFAEAVVSRFGGPAVAVAAVPWAELPLLPLPSCDVQVGSTRDEGGGGVDGMEGILGI